MLIGYARVSSQGQKLDVQIDALTGAGCERIFSEKKSGTEAGARLQLKEALQALRNGDTLIVTRLDRLARSVSDLLGILEEVTRRGATFKCIQQSGVDTDSSTGKLMLTILGAVAAFEADIRRERQLEGIAKAKAAGVYKGRKASIDRGEVRRLNGQKVGATEIAKTLGISRASVYRVLEEADASAEG